MTAEPVHDAAVHPDGRQRWTRTVAAQARHLRRRWYLVLPALGIWGLAFLRLFVDPTPRTPLLFNWTPSLPYLVAWRLPMQAPLQRGDLILYSFEGEAQARYPGLRRQPFFKQVRGLPGDVVTVQDRRVQVNGEDVGWAKAHAHDRQPLAPIAPLVIPPGHYYVQGTSPDSFDSRYQGSGLVRADQVLGRVVPLL